MLPACFCSDGGLQPPVTRRYCRPPNAIRRLIIGKRAGAHVTQSHRAGVLPACLCFRRWFATTGQAAVLMATEYRIRRLIIGKRARARHADPSSRRAACLLLARRMVPAATGYAAVLMAANTIRRLIIGKRARATSEQLSRRAACLSCSDGGSATTGQAGGIAWPPNTIRRLINRENVLAARPRRASEQVLLPACLF